MRAIAATTHLLPCAVAALGPSARPRRRRRREDERGSHVGSRRGAAPGPARVARARAAVVASGERHVPGGAARVRPPGRRAEPVVRGRPLRRARRAVRGARRGGRPAGRGGRAGACAGGPRLAAAGAGRVGGRELVRALVASGLRLPKRGGERVLATWPAVTWPGHALPVRVDCLVSPLPTPAATTIGSVLLAVRGGAVLLDESVDALPVATSGRPCGYLRARFGDVGGREHVAALRPAADVAGRLPGRWLPVQRAAQLHALRRWAPLVEPLAGRSPA